MPAKILDVGNCVPDHTAFQQLVRDQFGAEVMRVEDGAEALQVLQESDYDLVTVNRLMDRDGSCGLEVIQSLKSSPAGAHLPVMMITNFPEHQQRAIAVGAVPGFGKAALHDPETCELLRPYLAMEKRASGEERSS